MAKKTKAELLEEIEVKNKEIENLKGEVEKLDRYKTYETVADEFGAIRESFENAGFSKTEAFTMTLKIVELATNPTVVNMFK